MQRQGRKGTGWLKFPGKREIRLLSKPELRGLSYQKSSEAAGSQTRCRNNLPWTEKSFLLQEKPSGGGGDGFHLEPIYLCGSQGRSRPWDLGTAPSSLKNPPAAFPLSHFTLCFSSVLASFPDLALPKSQLLIPSPATSPCLAIPAGISSSQKPRRTGLLHLPIQNCYVSAPGSSSVLRARGRSQQFGILIDIKTGKHSQLCNRGPD